jgi:hypothetical protein
MVHWSWRSAPIVGFDHQIANSHILIVQPKIRVRRGGTGPAQFEFAAISTTNSFQNYNPEIDHPIRIDLLKEPCET